MRGGWVVDRGIEKDLLDKSSSAGSDTSLSASFVRYPLSGSSLPVSAGVHGVSTMMTS